jgi:REP element-mobilizing transposase RayT
MVNQYHRKSIRLKNYDYSQSGYYFVTISTKKKKLYFKNDRIRKKTEEFWLAIPNRFKNIKLDAYVLMPNHIHGIIIICTCRDTPWRVPTFGTLTKKSLSSIINQYKGSVKRWCNKNGLSYFEWQPRYYEHIIRNNKELARIREYIINNPTKWNLDAENPEIWRYRKEIDINKYYRNIFT